VTDNLKILHPKQKVRTVHPGVHVIGATGNAFAIETDRGVIQVDTGRDSNMAQKILECLRTVTDAPVHTIVYSHGHQSYNNGAKTFLEDAEQRGEPRPQVAAHELLPVRFRRYLDTWGLQWNLNHRQFRLPPTPIPPPQMPPFPDVTFSEILRLNMGNRNVEILWAPSETDDSIAVWLPEEGVLYGGPAVIMSCINIGTPLRTQRYAVRWAETLEKFIALRPKILILSFGETVSDPDEIQRMLGLMAESLRYLQREVIKRMNQGMTDVEIIHDITYPPELFQQPWTGPVYGCPDYIVRDIYRSENGWWDRNPTSLHPAHPDRAAEAVLEAIKDRKFVLEKARALKDAGEIQLALHVIDLLALAPGDDSEVNAARKLKSELLHLRSNDVPSFVSTFLYLSAADRLDERN
jgi:alkyl sulfatase BDS1-like metallo-beta-lactamase superfamily hydrolase